ncbi:MAG: acyl-CoA dehydratase activase [bacterium]
MDRFFAGIDVGSLTAETVIIDEAGTVRAYNIFPTGANSRKAAELSVATALEASGLRREDILCTVVTGYGRISVPFADKKITEISCHARGARHFFSATRTIIDIGGQDSKVIRLDESGKVIDFSMNDKCAAGTGRFLEVMGRALEVELDEMGELSLKSAAPVPITSMCTVFAESEVVSLIAQGKAKEDIISGLHEAISQRIVGMVRHIGGDGEITMTGGVAKNQGVVDAISKKLGCKLNIPSEPQIVGALGAALLAREECENQEM